MSVPAGEAEELRARFLELAPEGFEEAERSGEVELAAYGEAAERVAEAFPDAVITEVADGWEDRWREFHHGALVGGLWVGPPWESPPDGVPRVIIDPGRAFGTGAHPTTRLCLELLAELPRGSLLDVGCGSGVLAIAASQLGFDPVCAVDIDEFAIAATEANAKANGVTVDAYVLDALADALPVATIAVANIAFDAVCALGPLLRVERVVTSGYLVRDLPDLDGFQRTARRVQDGWAADLHVSF